MRARCRAKIECQPPLAVTSVAAAIAYLVGQFAALAALAAAPIDVRTASDLYHAGEYRQSIEMLDQLLAPQAAARLSAPVLTAALQLAVDVNRASGRFDTALNYARQWENLLEHESGSSGPNMTAQRRAALLAVADLQMSLEQPAEAEKSLQQALALPRGGRLSDPIWEADAQVRLARAVAAQADAHRKKQAILSHGKPAGIVESDMERREKEQWQTAETAAQAALERCEREKLPATQFMAAAKLQVECLIARNQAQEGAEFVKQLLDEHKEFDDFTRIELASELAKCQHAVRDFAAERETLHKALEPQQKTDRGQPTVAQAGLLNRIAVAAAAQGDDAAAEKKWKEAAKVYQQVLDQFDAQPNQAKPEMQFVDLQCLQGLQEIDFRLNDWAGGVQVSRRLLDRLTPRLRSDDPALVRAKTTLGAFLAKTDDWNNARPLLTEAAHYWRERTPGALAELAGVLVNLAEIARQTGSFAQAQALVEEALAADRKTLVPDDIKLAETLSNLAAVQNARGRFAEGATEFSRSGGNLPGGDKCRQSTGGRTARHNAVEFVNAV